MEALKPQLDIVLVSLLQLDLLEQGVVSRGPFHSQQFCDYVLSSFFPLNSASPRSVDK